MTESQPLTRLRDLPAALLRNPWVQLFVALVALLELYNHAAISAYITTQKGIEVQAIADNAALRQKAEAELAEWKSLTETEIAKNAERRQHAEATKATADAKRTEAEAIIARETAKNAEMKAKAEAEAALAEAAIKQQQIVVERERAAQAQRFNQAQTTNSEYQVAAETVATMYANNRVRLDARSAIGSVLSGR